MEKSKLDDFLEEVEKTIEATEAIGSRDRYATEKYRKERLQSNAYKRIKRAYSKLEEGE